jgi:hypothetical protein
VKDHPDDRACLYGQRFGECSNLIHFQKRSVTGADLDSISNVIRIGAISRPPRSMPFRQLPGKAFDCPILNARSSFARHSRIHEICVVVCFVKLQPFGASGNITGQWVSESSDFEPRAAELPGETARATETRVSPEDRQNETAAGSFTAANCTNSA